MALSDYFAASSFAITQGVGAFNNFLPKLTDIRKEDPKNNPEFAADVRMGEAAAVGLMVGLGGISSVMHESPIPLIVAIFTAVFLVMLYEATLNGRPFSHAAWMESGQIA
jgi:heme O synthase-like polyprenyltransferase